MKHALLTLAAGVLLTTSAQAADIYQNSMKDAGAPAYTKADHSGFAVRAFIGYAWGDRDVDTTARAFLNCTNAYELSEDADERAAQLKEIEAYVSDVNKAGIFASSTNDATAAKIVIPLISAFFDNSGNDEFGSMVFGAEVEHLWHRGQFGLGVAAAANFYGNAETKTTFANVPTFFGSGTLFNPDGGPTDIETGATVSGFTTVDRKFDIDLTLKAYWFAAQDTAFYVKAGPSFARASIKSHAAVDGTDFGLDYKNDDTAIGYVVGAGVVHWVNPNLSVSLDGDYKQHSFEAKGSSETEIGSNCFCDSLSVAADGKTSVDDSVFTVKAGAAYHF